MVKMHEEVIEDGATGEHDANDNDPNVQSVQIMLTRMTKGPIDRC